MACDRPEFLRTQWLWGLSVVNKKSNKHFSGDLALDLVHQLRGGLGNQRRCVAGAAAVYNRPIGQDRKQAMAKGSMLRAGATDMRKIRLHTRSQAGSPAAEACGCEGQAAPVTRRVHCADRHVSRALSRCKEAIVSC
ncbi:hypothetical protein GCM10007291_30580 [Gemmobacter nanjingensis]|uniref:Uncharacterized protein n=1 Tax=Gemmobacter nanjingensis TaxID=488454 RepID=A0ABQ3FKQ1_9RHOB|nr:hypothetical protein GCM10007291_30580 [Gemmobacter nanjingensis]